MGGSGCTAVGRAPPPDHSRARARVPAGGLQAVADLLQVDYEMHKTTRDPLNLALRRYAGMTLTNLTFGDVANKVRGAGGGGGRRGAGPARRRGQHLPRPHPSLQTALRHGDSCPQLLGG